MNKVVKILGMVSLLVSSQVSAVATWHTSKIKTVYPLANGSVVITFINDSDTCQNGSSPKYYYLAANENGVTEAGLRNIYSAALVAAASGKDVIISFESATSACYINRLSVVFN